MLLRLCTVLWFFTIPSFSEGLEFTFEKWSLQNSERYVTELIETHKNLSDADLQRSMARVLELKKTNDWGAIALECERIAAKKSDQFENWLNLAEAYAHKAISMEQNWDAKNKASLAAIKAFLLGKNDAEKAQALLLYAESSYDWSDERTKIQSLLGSTDDLKKVKADPRFAEFLTFKYVDYSLNTNQSPAEVTFSFNGELAEQNIGDFVESNPKVDAKVKISGRNVIIKGLNYGTSYNFTLKAGIKGKFGDILKTPVNVGVKVTDQSSRLGFKSQQYILQKAESLSIPLEVVNIDKVQVKILRLADHVIPGNLARGGYDATFLKNLNSYDFKQLKKVESHMVFEGEMLLKGERNTTRMIGIPLDEAIKDQKPGAYVIYVMDKSGLQEGTSASQWVIVTDMGLTTFSGNDGLHVDVRKLSTAKSYKGVKVNLISHNQSLLDTKQTDDNGHVVFEKALLQGKDGNRPLMLACYGEGSDFTLIDLTKSPLDLSDLSISGSPSKQDEDLYIYADRGIYRPGEVIHVQALLRNSKLQGVKDASLTFKLIRPDGVAFKIDSVQGNDIGLFEHTFALLDSSPTGRWVVQGFADPKDKEPLFETVVNVEDFTPARILVKAETKEKSLSSDTSLEASVKAEYLFGGKAGDLAAEAVVLFSKDLSPFENYKNFKFGDTLEEYTPQRLEVGLSALDEKGTAIINIDGKSVQDASTPLLAQLRVNVFDRGGKPQLGTAKFPTFTKPFYLGIQSLVDRVDGNADAAEFKIVAVGKDGTPQKIENCTWTLSKEKVDYTWWQSDGKWRYNVIRTADVIDEGVVTLLGAEPTSFSVKVGDWGDYLLEVRDTKTGALSKIRFTKGWGRGDRVDVPDILKIRLDKETYKVGEDVDVRIESPFAGEALLSIANASGIIYQQSFLLVKGETSYKIKAQESFGTGSYVLLNGFRAIPGNPEEAQLPVRAVGLAWCAMDSDEKNLDLKLAGPAFAKPREAFNIEVSVDNAAKFPVYLTLAAVDEGILLLTDYKNPDPLKHFFGKKEFPLELRDLYGHIIQDSATETGAFHTGGDEGALARNLAALSKRSFKLVSLYSGIVFLQNGKAKIPFQMPDFNGKVRIMGVVASMEKVGSAQTSVTVKDPIVVEAILPRFLAPGDKSQLILSLHNQVGKDEEVTLKIKTEGPVAVEKETLMVKLPKDSEQVFTLPITADKAGEGTITIIAKGSGDAQEYTYDLSVREGLPFKTKEESLLLEPGKPFVLSLKDMEGFVEETAKVALSFGKSPWNSSKSAYLLAEYPYNCIEQTVSKGFGLLYLKEAEGDKSEIALNNIISKIAQDQGLNGGFDFWPGMESSQSERIFLSAYVYDFLSTAKKARFIVPSFTFDNLEKFLKNTLTNLSDKTNTEMMRASSYALYVLMKEGAVEPGTVRYFYETFFESIESPFARACVVYALSTFSDEARLKGALEKLNLTSSKDLLEMLQSFKIIEEAAGQNSQVKESMTQTLPILMNQIKEKMNGSTSFSTQERAWMVRGATPSVEEIALNVDGKKIAEKGPLFREFISTDIDHTFENLNQTPLWISKITSGQLKDHKPISQGIKLTRKFYDMAGQEIKADTLSQGQQVVVVMEGSVEGDKNRNLLLVDLLPAAVQLDVLPKLPWLGELTPTTMMNLRDDRFVTSFTVDEKINTFKIAYLMRVVTLGEYLHPGTFVEDMIDARVYGQNAPLRMTVDARKVEKIPAPTLSTHVHTHNHVAQ